MRFLFTGGLLAPAGIASLPCHVAGTVHHSSKQVEKIYNMNGHRNLQRGSRFDAT
jgi:hypothetical protein